jgi:hypothetical protein
MTTAINSISLAGVLLALCACTLPGSPKPTDQTAVLKEGPWGKVYRGGYVEIDQADWRLHSAVLIPAGDRSTWFSVYLCNADPTHCTAIARAQVSFRAQAGHTYRPRAEEKINGSNRFWMWVEDEGSGQPVSDRVVGAPGA